MKIYFSAIALSLLLLPGCGNNPLEAPEAPAVVENVPANWSQEQSRRQENKSQYLANHQEASDWFSLYAFSETDGVPFILLKLLPMIAPEYWSGEDNFLQVVGLNNDPAKPGYPLAIGIGISTMARTEKMGNIDYTSFTCAACHIGRVRTSQGELKLIEGGVNAEFNIVQYRVRVYQTLQKVFKDETDQAIKNTLLVNAFMAALETAQNKSAHYFYNNYRSEIVDFSGTTSSNKLPYLKRMQPILSLNLPVPPKMNTPVMLPCWIKIMTVFNSNHCRVLPAWPMPPALAPPALTLVYKTIFSPACSHPIFYRRPLASQISCRCGNKISARPVGIANINPLLMVAANGTATFPFPCIATWPLS